jgi:APA family basic amino acid/polyamine antiporter
VFFTLAAVALLRFRRQDGDAPVAFRMPLQPWSTILFGVISIGVVASVVAGAPRDASIGLGIMLAGLPVYWIFTRFASS